MEPPRDRTTVQIAYDDRALYVAVRCYAKNSSQITAGLGRRDNPPPSDLIRMSFDPRHDHQNAYVFEVNPSGVQNDYIFYDDTRQSPHYDAVWEVGTSITSEAWFAEYRIPFSQMRFTVRPGERSVWGFNLRRDIYKTGEYYRWVATPRGAAGFVSRFGHLIFDDDLAPPRRVEVLPVSLARLEHATSSSTEASGAAGVDLRVGLGTAATLSATINPDFAQVEQSVGAESQRVRNVLPRKASVLSRRQPHVRAELPADAVVPFATDWAKRPAASRSRRTTRSSRSLTARRFWGLPSSQGRRTAGRLAESPR